MAKLSSRKVRKERRAANVGTRECGLVATTTPSEPKQLQKLNWPPSGWIIVRCGGIERVDGLAADCFYADEINGAGTGPYRNTYAEAMKDAWIIFAVGEVFNE